MVTSALPPSTCFKYLGPLGQAMQASSTPGCRLPQRHTWGPPIVNQQWAFASLSTSAAQQPKHSSCGKFSFHPLLHLAHSKYWGTALPLPREGLTMQWASLPAICTTFYRAMYKVHVSTSVSRHGDPCVVSAQTSQPSYKFWSDLCLAIIKVACCFSILAVSNVKETCTGPEQKVNNDTGSSSSL